MYSHNHYKNLTEEEIKNQIELEGFNPIKFTDNPGYIYQPHSHPETKLLAFLNGSMRVTVDNDVYECKAGDKLIIRGEVMHSAKVGSEGCTFFWSEKLM